MKSTLIKFETSPDRPLFIGRTYRPYLTGRVLDVGCGPAALRSEIGPERYVGVDVGPDADLRVDLQTTGKLPFPDKAFEAVVCTDVLEHLDNLHQIFDELVRVSGSTLIVTLPNNWNSARVRLRRGRGAICQYGLPLTPPKDRHRWFFSLEEAEKFLRGQAQRHDLEIVELVALEKPRSMLLRAARRILHSRRDRYLNLYAHTVVCLYRRRS